MAKVSQAWLDKAQKIKDAETLRLMAKRNRREVEVLHHVITYVGKGQVLSTRKLIYALEAEAKRWEREAAERDREAWRRTPATPPSPEMSNDINDLAGGVRK